MTTLKDTIEIKTVPEKIFNSLIRAFSSEENFKTWHKDHVKCQWLRGKPFEIGSVVSNKPAKESNTFWRNQNG